MSTQFIITADSTPIYDTWGWADYWTADDWIKWHKLMKEKYGLNEANYRFIKAYVETETLGAETSWRSLNSTFRQYARENGFFEGLFDGIGGLIVRPIGWVLDAGQSTGEIIENTGNAVSETTKTAATTLKYIPFLLMAAATIVGYYFLKRKKLI